ncbi:HAD family hydrolase [Actinoplanes sp. NPDC051861]|uniref:HAD family hydrolase n=1 Tax=Actinoplanes sp. NPDC051861 TaxID=3155170 RepID=UPI003433FE9E
MDYRGYLVDVFGTLIEDDESRVLAACKHISEMSEMSLEAVVEDWENRIWAAAEEAHGPRFRSLAELTVRSVAETAAHFGVRMDARAVWAQGRTARAFEDGLRFLETVDAPVCLVSDVDRGDLERVLLHHRIVVEGVVTSEDARAYKPRPEPFLMALNKLGMDPGDVLHVGDSVDADLAGATALEIDTAFVDRRGRGLPAGVTATYVVRSLDELA